MTVDAPSKSLETADGARETVTTTIDWHEVARQPAVASLGALLRRQLNVWVGFIGPSGAAVPIGAAQPVAKPLCDAFMGRRDGAGSCQASVRRWLDAMRGDEVELARGVPTVLGCHAGLQSLVVPVIVEGAIVSAVYASGFLPADSGELEEHEVFKRGRTLELGQSVVAGGMRELTRLTEREQRLVGELLVNLVDRATSWLGEDRGGGRKVVRRRAGTHDYRPIIGESPAMKRLFAMLDKVVESDSTVLIHGEPGVGKELVARAIHRNSARCEEAFVAQNCSAMNDSLLDSELFGHKRGSFTGAISDKQGLFELADSGTFFLDEIGDMSAMLQVKLLRVLQEGTFLPVGDTVVRKVDVRILAATHRDLAKMMRENTFRADLYYRMAVLIVEVPPLRERREDIPLLVAHFLETRSAANLLPPARITDEALERLMVYEWPGNVRELENEIERLVVMSDGVIEASALSPRILASSGHAITSPNPATGIPSHLTLPEALESLERHMIHEKLKQTGWNKTRSAKALGISRRNLIRKVDRYQLDELRPDGSDDGDEDDDE